MADTDVDIDYARTALERSLEKFVALLEGGVDARRPLRRSDWTVGDVATHLVLMTEAYIEFAKGGTEPFVDLDDVAGGSLARSSAARLRAEPERDLGALSKRLTAATQSLLDVADGRSSTDPVLWNGHKVTLGQMLGILLGEFLLHGLDVAKALSRPWAILPDDARLVLLSVLPLLPLLVDSAATAKVDATYDIRIRGGARVSLSIDHGEGRVSSESGPAACHVSADPVAMLLVSYGRRSQWGPALTGKVVAWGRKPWLGLRLTHFLVAP